MDDKQTSETRKDIHREFTETFIKMPSHIRVEALAEIVMLRHIPHHSSPIQIHIPIQRYISAVAGVLMSKQQRTDKAKSK